MTEAYGVGHDFKRAAASGSPLGSDTRHEGACAAARRAVGGKRL